MLKSMDDQGDRGSIVILHLYVCLLWC